MLLSRKVYIGVGIILVAAVSAVLAVPLMQKAEQGVINPPAEVAKPVEATEAEQNLALFFGQDDRIFISAPYAAPFNAIGKLETEAASQCTATLVAPNLAVTAAHCFFMEPHKFDKGRWFWAGYHQGKWQARYQVTGQVFHSRFRKGLDYVGEGVYIKPAVAGYDIAWLKLKWIEGARPRPIPLFSGSEAQLMSLVEQHENKVHQAGFAGDHDAELTAHLHCKVTDFFDDHTLGHQCDTLSGDSGSPLWLETKQGPLLIAVQSAAPDWYNRHKADNTAVPVFQLPKKPR